MRFVTTSWASILCIVGALASTAQAQTIERCGPYFRYADMEFMRGNINKGCLGARWPSTGLPLGYTLSTTPPDAEVDFIDEHLTVCFPLGMFKSQIVSQGRKIPRDRLTHVPEAAAPYLKNVSTPLNEGCQRMVYTPPASARNPDSATLARREPIYVGAPVTGLTVTTDITTHFVVGQERLVLWGVNGVPWRGSISPLAAITERLECRAADVGGHVCRAGSHDIAVSLLERGLARVKPDIVYAPYVNAQAAAKSAKAGVWAEQSGGSIACRRAILELERTQRRAASQSGGNETLLRKLEALRDSACRP